MSGKRARSQRKETGQESNQPEEIKQQAGACIFCQKQGDMSKQHIWPSWMQQLVVDFNAKTRHTTRGFAPNVGSYHNVKDSNGRPGAQRIRIVCSACNNGWINTEVETKMRPIFTDIISHNTNTISTEDQLNLALWAVLATMVYEFRDPKTMATTQLERDYLYQTKLIPAKRQVWIGRMRLDPGYTQYIAHRGIRVGDAYNLTDNDLVCNTSCTVFAVNELVIVTSKLPVSVQAFPFLGAIGQKLMPIYPAHRQIEFDKLSILSSREVDEIRNSFHIELRQLSQSF